MYTVQFPQCRVVEYTDPQKIEQRLVRWLLQREAENSYLLGNMRDIYASFSKPPAARTRVFGLEEDGMVTGTAIWSPDGCVVLSWMTRGMMSLLANHLREIGCVIRMVYAPAHESWRFAQEWAQRSGLGWEMGMEERVYQLIRVRPPAGVPGRMVAAGAAERPLLLQWMEHFIHETHFPDPRTEYLVDELLRQQRLFVWADGQPVAMAAWVMPTPRGACISFVYTPPEFRGRGYAKAVVAGLASHMLESGLEYCFIYTDTGDKQTNSLYQAVGARTLCEFMRCAILPRVSERPGSAAAAPEDAWKHFAPAP